MRVLIVNTSERIGGAAIAASRLMNALKRNNVKAKMLVRDKQTDEVSVVALRKSWQKIWNFLWERLVIWVANAFSKQNLFAVDIANAGTDITSLHEFEQADLIHLHWINQGMLSINNIRKILQSGKPVVWTMHDMWPVTGICHHANTCEAFKTECHHCPLLHCGSRKDLSNSVFHKKMKCYGEAKFALVGCSRWIAGRALQSALTKGMMITNIPNPIDTDLFQPLDKVEARRRCHLPKEKKLLLFGSVKINNKQKGIDYLIEACKHLKQKYPDWSQNLGVVVFGQNADRYASLFPFPCYAMNYVSSEQELVQIYNSVDLYVTSSLMENLPNTIMEAMACGIPCVGFNIGGIPEMIDHQQNGYVAEYQSANDLADGIKWSLQEEEYPKLRISSRKKVLRSYSEEIVAKQYISLYHQLLNSHA